MESLASVRHLRGRKTSASYSLLTPYYDHKIFNQAIPNYLMSNRKELRRANNKDDNEPLVVSDEILALIEAITDLTHEIRRINLR